MHAQTKHFNYVPSNAGGDSGRAQTIMTVVFDCLLGPGLSFSHHTSHQAELYSIGQWIEFLFHEEVIATLPDLRNLTLTE